MGVCCSNRIKAESPFQSGVNSKNVSRDGIYLSSSSSKPSSASIPATPRSEGEILQSPNLKSFSFGELKTATRNFRLDSVIGEGGFGSVYKGWMDEQSLAASNSGFGMVVAVKRLNQEGFQGHKEWLSITSVDYPVVDGAALVEAAKSTEIAIMVFTHLLATAEINYLGQLHHPNLVKLIGYCLEDEHRLLVYEFMPRGSMENHLFRRGPYFQPLSWSLRMSVALGAARGLAFLHSAETKVIYRDFKTSNILLDSNYNAKLSDFGLARDGPTGDKTHVSTRVIGTYGYAAPEYLATGHLTSKSDVYSFGVVFLEILSGRKAIDKNRPTGQHNLVDWAKPYLINKRRIFRVLDARLEGQYSLPRTQKAAGLALQCLDIEPKFRPNMDEVVTALEQLQDSKDTTKSTKKDHQLHPRSQSSGGPRGREEASKRNVSYPRPSTSPLYK